MHTVMHMHTVMQIDVEMKCNEHLDVGMVHGARTVLQAKRMLVQDGRNCTVAHRWEAAKEGQDAAARCATAC